MLPFILTCLFSVGSAIVCTPELCKNAVQEPLNCAGSVIKNGGFCGCTDVCSKQENEVCQSHYMFGIIPAGSCDTGLTCTQNTNQPMAIGRGICVKTEHADSRRALPTTLTACQQMKRLRMISMAIWQGWWMPKCDVSGNFELQQCDNTGKCFCVDSLSGEIDKSTMVQGSTTCSSKRETKLTACQQMRSVRQISMVTWRGWFIPKCDESGNFELQQCDNIGRCFCVDKLTGETDKTTMVQGSTTCLNKRETKMTACQQMKSIRSISFVIWQGWFMPKCDAYGNFEPEQCDNTGHCFCVEAVSGTVDESSKVLGSPGSANCATTS